jgi:hypothetical protein
MLLLVQGVIGRLVDNCHLCILNKNHSLKVHLLACET